MPPCSSWCASGDGDQVFNHIRQALFWRPRHIPSPLSRFLMGLFECHNCCPWRRFGNRAADLGHEKLILFRGTCPAVGGSGWGGSHLPANSTGPHLPTLSGDQTLPLDLGRGTRQESQQARPFYGALSSHNHLCWAPGHTPPTHIHQKAAWPWPCLYELGILDSKPSHVPDSLCPIWPGSPEGDQGDLTRS